MQEYLMIGEITKPQGVHGELKLRPLTCDPTRFDGLTRAYIAQDGEYRPVSIAVRGIAPDAVFFRMEGVETRDDAEKMRGTALYIDRAHAVALDEDSCFLCDLIGLTGKVSDGSTLGKLTEVLQPGGTDIYVFKTADGEVLVPALKAVVLKVDLAAGEMLLDEKRLSEVAVYNHED